MTPHLHSSVGVVHSYAEELRTEEETIDVQILVQIIIT